MNCLRPKGPRIHLEPEAYRRLRQQILARDGWRCQNCGGSSQLQVHHITSRSRQGDDAEQNLMTLCSSCHGKLHVGGVVTRFSI
jgi:5-methylcytosine-specific restriction endonuclease McrA